jgi:hypothetical protein
MVDLLTPKSKMKRRVCKRAEEPGAAEAQHKKGRLIARERAASGWNDPKTEFF